MLRVNGTPACATTSNDVAIETTTQRTPRVVLYLTGDLGEEYQHVLRLSAAVESRGWKVVGVRSDAQVTKTAWLRKGLLSAITIVCHGQADGIAMSDSEHELLSSDDQNWLQQRVKRFGGFLHIVSAAGETSPQ